MTWNSPLRGPGMQAELVLHRPRDPHEGVGLHLGEAHDAVGVEGSVRYREDLVLPALGKGDLAAEMEIGQGMESSVGPRAAMPDFLAAASGL